MAKVAQLSQGAKNVRYGNWNYRTAKTTFHKTWRS